MATSEEELRHIVAESVAGGHLSRSERVMIENVLNLEEKTARRIMIPRPDIVYLSMSRPLEDNLRVARQAGHTRYPLCEDDLTSVIGMIHVKDLFRAGGSANFRPDLRKSARPTPFLPASLRLDQLLGEFQRNRVHLAMLLDEYGSLVGMVSLENVLEEVVGPIQDEFDRETPQVVPLGGDAFEVDATCPLDILAETIGVELPETDAETAGGLILDLLGRLARSGDSVVVDDHRLVVVRADPTRIRTIRVERCRPDTPLSATARPSVEPRSRPRVAGLARSLRRDWNPVCIRIGHPRLDRPESMNHRSMELRDAVLLRNRRPGQTDRSRRRGPGPLGKVPGLVCRGLQGRGLDRSGEGVDRAGRLERVAVPLLHRPAYPWGDGERLDGRADDRGHPGGRSYPRGSNAVARRPDARSGRPPGRMPDQDYSPSSASRCSRCRSISRAVSRYVVRSRPTGSGMSPPAGSSSRIRWPASGTWSSKASR